MDACVYVADMCVYMYAHVYVFMHVCVYVYVWEDEYVSKGICLYYLCNVYGGWKVKSNNIYIKVLFSYYTFDINALTQYKSVRFTASKLLNNSLLL